MEKSNTEGPLRLGTRWSVMEEAEVAAQGSISQVRQPVQKCMMLTNNDDDRR